MATRKLLTRPTEGMSPGFLNILKSSSESLDFLLTKCHYCCALCGSCDFHKLDLKFVVETSPETGPPSLTDTEGDGGYLFSICSGCFCMDTVFNNLTIA